MPSSRSRGVPPRPFEHLVAKSELQAVIDRFAAGRSGLQVLEAGCGSCTNLKLPEHVNLVGIDISEKQLARNDSLHEKILGDLESHPLQKEAFDLIVSWYVLEHLPHPESALENMVAALKPGGVLVLVLPKVFSVKGLVTKFSPHGAHVWFYRHLLGRKDAGTEDRGPFKTYLRTSISSAGILRFAAARGLDPIFHREFCGYLQRTVRDDYPALDLAYRVATPLVRLLSLGAVSVDSTEFMTALQKRRADP